VSSTTGTAPPCTPTPTTTVVEFRWGGCTLALAPLDVLTGDQPLVGQFVAEVPDDLAELDEDDLDMQIEQLPEAPTDDDDDD
jgi:hypothetical protein